MKHISNVWRLDSGGRGSCRSLIPPVAWLGGSLALPATVLVVCAFLFIYRLGDRELTSSHEARAGQNAISVVKDGQWALPRLLDQRIELQKPPLYYWLVALSAWLQSGVVDGWAVRLPAALSALGCVFVVVSTLWHRGRPLAGCLSGAILATFVHFTWLARTGRIDMPLTLFVTLALCAFYLAQSSNYSGRLTLLGYTATAFGILLKGPIAAVFVFVVIVPMNFIQGRQQAKEIRRSLWWGVPLVAVLALPWFVWANLQTEGRFFDVFFWYHNVQRGLGGSDLATHPWWYYFPRLVVDLLPWSMLLPLGVIYAWKNRDDADARFGAVWLLAVFGFLSLMRFKRSDYLLPAYPAAALMLGCCLERVLTKAGRPGLRKGLVVGALVACFAGWVIYIQWFEPERSAGAVQRQLAQDIRRRTEFPVIFFRVEDHALAFHVGRPLDTILEWENLDWWATQPVPVCIVMRPDSAGEWPNQLRHGVLREICRMTSDSRTLVLMQSVVPRNSESSVQ